MPTPPGGEASYGPVPGADPSTAGSSASAHSAYAAGAGWNPSEAASEGSVIGGSGACSALRRRPLHVRGVNSAL